MTARSVDLSRKPSTPEIEQARHRGSRGFGVQGCQHEVAGERRVNRDMGGFGIADFADHDDVGVLAHEGAQRRCECQPDGRLRLGLIDTRELVFDRVFDREDLAGRLVENRQDGGKRRGLAAAGRSGDHDHAVRQRQERPQLLFVGRREAELLDRQQAAVLGQEADDGGFPVLGRHDGDAHIEVASAPPAPARRRPAAGGAPRY